MPIKARISRFRTRPYESRELSEMSITEYNLVKSSPREKVLAEELILDMAAPDPAHLQQRILNMVEAHNPNPVIVTTPDNNEDSQIKHHFLVGKEYRSTDSNAVLETVLYRPKNPRSFQEKKEKEMQEWKSKHPAVDQKADEYMKRAVSSILEESIKKAGSLNEPFKKMGFADGAELHSFLMNLYLKRNDFANEEQFRNFLRDEYAKRVRGGQTSETVSTPGPSMTYLPSILTDEMTILCRIIGKNNILVSMYQDYYLKWHQISDPVFSVSNSTGDKLTARFVYGKDSAGE